MNSTAPVRVLCVDDEANVLAGLRRTLRRGFDVTTASGPEEGLRAIEHSEPFAAIISDLRMPRMDGITLLERARELAPQSVRLLLTGNADLSSCLDAVNRGAVFRFLLKPAETEVLIRAVEAAAEQHRLITAEQVLLEQTLHGSIQALTDILALINPAGFGRAARAKALAAEIIRALELPSSWQIEVAAMLSQIGTVTLPQPMVEKIYAGRPLTYSESVMAERLPRVASDVIASIPRMEEVREILLHQNANFDGKGGAPRTPKGRDLPLGARILKLVLDFDLLESQGLTRRVAVDTLRGREGLYDPELLDRLVEVCGLAEHQQKVLELELSAVRPGMTFAEDVQTTTGILLVARGQEVSDRLAERIHNFRHLVEAKQKVRVIVGDGAPSIKTAVAAG